MAHRRLGIFTAAILLTGVVSGQQVQRRIVGNYTSSAMVLIDDTEMRPTAAAYWPVVDGDEISATSAPALLTTADRNLVTFERYSKAKVKSIGNGQTYIYVRQGGVLYDTQTARLNICIANRLFEPGAGSRGILKLEKTGAVTRVPITGTLLRQGEQACNDEAVGLLLAEQPAAGSAGVAAGVGGVAGGTASAPAVAAGAAGASAGVGGAAGSAAGVAAGAVGAGSAAATGAVGSFSSSCTASGGCNHNPVSISPSTP
jgi:hypothetical protein